MKLFMFVFTTFFISSSIFANPVCMAQEKYKQRIDLENGQILFIEPGLYTNGKDYRLLCVNSGANPGFRCTPGVHEACKYLGMNKASSWTTKPEIDDEIYMYLRNGKIYFKNGYRESYVSELVCE